MRFATIILKNTIRRPFRSTLTVVAIAVAVGTMVVLVGVAAGFEHTFLSLYKGSGIGLIVVRAGAQRRLTSTLDEQLGARIREIPGVRAVIPGLIDVVSFEQLGLYGVIAQGWVPETMVFDHLRVISGRTIHRNDGKVVMLGSIAARNLGKQVGATVTIFESEDFRVVGIYRSTSVYEEGAIVMPLDQLQRLLDRRGQVTGFSIIPDDPAGEAALERVRCRVERLDEDLHAMTTEEHVRSISEIQLARAMAWLTSAVALVVGTLEIMSTMVMSVHERTREIGVLRAVGWRRWRVVRMLVSESVALSLAGGLLGTLGACLLVRLLTLVPNANTLIDGRIPPIVILYGWALALLVGVSGGLLPAYHAATMVPTAALRQE